jgi:hypothetical protein
LLVALWPINEKEEGKKTKQERQRNMSDERDLVLDGRVGKLIRKQRTDGAHCDTTSYAQRKKKLWTKNK